MAHFDTDYQRLEASYSDSPPGEENLLMHVPEGAKCITFITHTHYLYPEYNYCCNNTVADFVIHLI